MNKLQEYIKHCFKGKKWFFISSITAMQATGETFETDLSELKEKQMIKISEGVNGKLIQMINLEKWEL